MQVRVATYNIRGCLGLDWRRDPSRVLRVIGELGADVVALQEADRRFGGRPAALPEAILNEAGWRIAGIAIHRGGIGWHGNAILLGPGVEQLEAERLPLPALEPRGAVLCEISVRGQHMRVVGTHLGLTPGRRALQAKAITQALGDRPALPTVVMGDMNEPRAQSGCIRILGQIVTFPPPLPTYHTRRPLAALDRIAVSREIAIAGHGVHATAATRQASDHLPLWADLTLPG